MPANIHSCTLRSGWIKRGLWTVYTAKTDFNISLPTQLKLIRKCLEFRPSTAHDLPSEVIITDVLYSLNH